MDGLIDKGKIAIKYGLFIVIEMILCVFMIWNTFMKRSEMVSILFALSFIVLLFLFLTKIPYKANAFFTLTVCILGLALVSVIISWSKNSVAFTFDRLKSYFIFCATIICIYLSVEIEINQKYRKLLVALCIIIATMFPMATLTIDFILVPYFTMNFTNPNLTGMYLVQAVFYSVLGIANCKKPAVKLFCIIVAIANAVLLSWTKARNGFLAMILFFTMLIWLLAQKKRNIPDVVLRISAIFPMLFVFLYLSLIKLEVVKETFDFVADVGKPLTSRVEIWTRQLKELGTDFFTGNYFELSGNAHNSHLVVLQSYGLIVLALTVFFLYWAMVRVNERCTTKAQMVCLAAFIGALFVGMGEGALFSGGVGLYIMCCVPLILGKSECENSV